MSIAHSCQKNKFVLGAANLHQNKKGMIFPTAHLRKIVLVLL
jgi:hypothetical protein